MTLGDLVATLRWRGRVIEPNSIRAWAYASAVMLLAGLAFPFLSLLAGTKLPPFITFYPAVVIAALAGGPGIGIAAALGSLATAWWLIMDGPANLFTPSVNTPALIYLATSTFLGWTVGEARLALDRAVVAEQFRTNAARESIHRIKNLLAVVQGIVRKVYREVDSKEQFRTVLNSRLAALGNAQDVLIKRDLSDLPIAALVTSALAPFLPNPGLKVKPGPEILVPGKHMAGLCLALFELATNSIKYGALTDGLGPVYLSWRFDDVHAVLEWEEETLTNVGQPEGFGVKLIRAALGGDRDTSVSYSKEQQKIHASFRWIDPRIS